MQTKTSLFDLFQKGKFFFYALLVEKGVYFLVYVYLARTSSVAEYGDLMTAFVFANILNAFFEFGFAPFFQREIAAASAVVTRSLNTALTFKIICAVPYALIALFYFWLVGITDTGAAVLIVSVVYIAGIGEIFSRILFGLNRFSQSFYALLFSRSILFIGIAVLFVMPLPSTAVLLLLLCSIVMQLIFLVRDLKKNEIILSFGFDFAVLKKIMSSSLPIGIGILFVWAYDKFDVLLINRFLGSESVSFYTVAYSIYKVPQMFTGIILTPLYTIFSQTFGRDGKLDTRMVLKPALLLFGLSVAAVSCITLFSEEFLFLSFGEKYIRSAWILTSLSFALPALFLNNLTGVILNSIKNERKAMLSAIYAFVLSISLNIFLLPLYGISVAVLATVCAEYGILFIQLMYLKNSENILWRTTTL